MAQNILDKVWTAPQKQQESKNQKYNNNLFNNITNSNNSNDNNTTNCNISENSNFLRSNYSKDSNSLQRISIEQLDRINPVISLQLKSYQNIESFMCRQNESNNIISDNMKISSTDRNLENDEVDSAMLLTNKKRKLPDITTSNTTSNKNTTTTSNYASNIKCTVEKSAKKSRIQKSKSSNIASTINNTSINDNDVPKILTEMEQKKLDKAYIYLHRPEVKKGKTKQYLKLLRKCHVDPPANINIVTSCKNLKNFDSVTFYTINAPMLLQNMKKERERKLKLVGSIR